MYYISFSEFSRAIFNFLERAKAGLSAPDSTVEIEKPYGVGAARR